MEKRIFVTLLRLLTVFGICMITSGGTVLAADQNDDVKLESKWLELEPILKNIGVVNVVIRKNNSDMFMLNHLSKLRASESNGKDASNHWRELLVPLQRASQPGPHVPEQRKVVRPLQKDERNQELTVNVPDADLRRFIHALENHINDPNAVTLDKVLCYITLNVSVRLEIIGRNLIRNAVKYLKIIGDVLHHCRGFLFVFGLVYLSLLLIFQLWKCYSSYKRRTTASTILITHEKVNSTPRSGKKRPATITIIDIANTKSGYLRMCEQTDPNNHSRTTKKMKLECEA